MAASFSARIAAVPSALLGLADRLEAFLTTERVPDTAVQTLLLVLDEIGVNIVNHAYDGGDGWVELAAETGRDEAVLTFRDGGRPFDPNTLAAPDTVLAAEVRPIGGLGVLLVRRLASRFDYQRDADGNRLTIAVAFTR